MGMLHPSEFSLTGPYSVSTQTKCHYGKWNTKYNIYCSNTSCSQYTIQITSQAHKKEQLFFHEGEEINLWFWGNVSKLLPNLITCWPWKLLLKGWEGTEHCTVNSKDSLRDMSHSKVEKITKTGTNVFHIIHNIVSHVDIYVCHA